MTIFDAIKNELNFTKTENGDLAYKSSGSACLDLFSLCGGMRENTSDLTKLFIRAFSENPVIAIKVLFYLRDIRNGLGERNSFRVCLKKLAQIDSEIAKKVIYAIPNYGRWDDVLSLLDTSVESDAIDLIKTQLEKDKIALQEKKEVSLLGKWLPSINTSSKASKILALKLMNVLKMKAVEYRKLCSSLRKEIQIIENNLRTKDYTFDYSKQPSQAMLRYKKAFIRNDNERYSEFLDKVIEQSQKIANGEEIPENEKVKLNTKTLYPYQIVSQFFTGCYGSSLKELSDSERLALEASWTALDRKIFDSKTIVVRDGSGSMYHNGDFSPINVATSLTLLFSEQLKGVFKNSFITFSSKPELIQIPESCDDLQKKLYYLATYNDCSNTNIALVYELLFKIIKSNSVPKEEMVERILIVSDMEFDFISSESSTFDFYKKKFNDAGYELPEIVFWNVCARDIHLPVTMNENGVKLVSGASANLFEGVISNDLKVQTPYEFMLKMLEPYSEFDRIM